MPKVVVAVDAMGGDYAPEAAVEGGALALRELPDLHLLLCGPEQRLKEIIGRYADVAPRMDVRDAPDTIDMHEAPVLAVRRKVNSSMVVAMLAVKNKEAGAVLSAGSTGALLAGGMLRVGRIHGIERPALAPILPGENGPFLLIDGGANVDCQPKYLKQFGLMGSIYMQKVLGLQNPKVGLVNIGIESEKGNQMSKEAYKLMTEQNIYNFIGNVEAREVPSGDTQVIVADGFDGNIILKYTEGLADTLISMLKAEIMAGGLRAKLGGLLLKPAMKAFKKRMDYEEYGGAPLLGVQGAVVKAHGSSNSTAFKNALHQAYKMVVGDVAGRIQSSLEQMEHE